MKKQSRQSTQRITASILFTLLSGIALAQPVAEGPWLVRARAVHLDSANGDNTGLGLSMNDKWIPEADISYFFTPSLALELVLTVPQKHTLISSALNA